MTKLVTMSALAAVLSVAIAAKANASPHRRQPFAHGGAATSHHGAIWRSTGRRRSGVAVGAAGGFAVGAIAGAVVASPYGPYVAPAPFYVSSPDVDARDTGHFHRDAGHDVWGHWGNYYGPMVFAP